MMWRKFSSAEPTASMVRPLITPAENVSRPSRMPREASSMVRIDLFGRISATTRRTALAPISSTATSSDAVVVAGDRSVTTGSASTPAKTEKSGGGNKGSANGSSFFEVGVTVQALLIELQQTAGLLDIEPAVSD